MGRCFPVLSHSLSQYQTRSLSPLLHMRAWCNKYSLWDLCVPVLQLAAFPYSWTDDQAVLHIQQNQMLPPDWKRIWLVFHLHEYALEWHLEWWRLRMHRRYCACMLFVHWSASLQVCMWLKRFSSAISKHLAITEVRVFLGSCQGSVDHSLNLPLNTGIVTPDFREEGVSTSATMALKVL